MFNIFRIILDAHRYARKWQYLNHEYWHTFRIRIESGLFFESEPSTACKEFRRQMDIIENKNDNTN